MTEEIKQAHANAASHIVGIFRAKLVADEETISEVIRLLSWHWEIMSNALNESIQYEMPAIVRKVQQLEKENEQLKAMLQLGVNYANG